MENNFFSYSLAERSTSKGLFNVYQAKNGGIYLCMGNSATELTMKQINELHLPLYDLLEFDLEAYVNHYPAL